MLSWFTDDILIFIGYATIGIGSLTYLVHRPHISRWGRFIVGLGFIAYGIVGFKNGVQLLSSIKTIIAVTPWSETESRKLVDAASWIDLISFILQFAFAAVGSGLIVNAIVVEKPLKKKDE